MGTARHEHGVIRQPLKTAAACLMLAAFASNAWARTHEAADEAAFTGVRLQIDNDLFARGTKSDRDYTGGIALTVSGRDAADGVLSMDPLLERIDHLMPGAHSRRTVVRHARQLGLMVFTPGDIMSKEPLHGERPYASLLFVSNGRVHVAADRRNAWSSGLTVGVLGLSMSERLHDAVHRAVGSELPRGYQNQISSGGEATARYTLARHYLWVANPAGTVDVKMTVQGSVGFLTETSAAIALRAGRFASPWWSFAPELTDYIAAPVPMEAKVHASELYFFTGVRVKARAYDAFLQGQFRDSAVHYSLNEIEPVVAAAWTGLVTQVLEQTQLSYTLNYQTAEIRRGAAARSAVWGGVQFSHSF